MNNQDDIASINVKIRAVLGLLLANDLINSNDMIHLYEALADLRQGSQPPSSMTVQQFAARLKLKGVGDISRVP
jgi:hypothetical protein